MQRTLSLLALFAPLLLGCPTSRSTARCSIIASPAAASSVPAKLTSMAQNPTNVPAPMSVLAREQLPVHCSGTLPPALRGSPVDDLTAVWVGAVAENGQSRRDCPVFPSKLTREDPQITAPVCGASACPNQQVAFGAGGATVHVLFYDDPTLHDLSRATIAPSGACYYRVYSMSVAWDGEAPK